MILTIENRKGDNGHRCDTPKCCGLGSDVCPAFRTTNLRPLYMARIMAQKLSGIPKRRKATKKKKNNNQPIWGNGVKCLCPVESQEYYRAIFCSASSFHQAPCNKQSMRTTSASSKTELCGPNSCICACCFQSAKQNCSEQLVADCQ